MRLRVKESVFINRIDGIWQTNCIQGAQWLSGRVLDLRQRGQGLDQASPVSLHCGP